MKVVRPRPRPDLLNPKFEGYKLSAQRTGDDVARTFPLDGHAHSGCARLDCSTDFQQLAYALQLNGLFGNPFAAYEACYFDAEHGLWRLEVGEEEISEMVLAGLQGLPASSAVSPSLVFLSKDTVLVCRGEAAKLQVLFLCSRTLQDIEIPPILRDSLSLCVVDARTEDSLVRVALAQLLPANGAGGKSASFLVHAAVLDLDAGCLLVEQSYTGKTRPLLVRLQADGIVLGSAARYSPLYSKHGDGDDGDKDRNCNQDSKHAETDGDGRALGQARAETDQVAPIPAELIEWDQDEGSVFLCCRLHSKDAPGSDVAIAHDSVSITVDGHCVFHDRLFKAVRAEASSWTRSDNTILFFLVKKEAERWPHRICDDPSPPAKPAMSMRYDAEFEDGGVEVGGDDSGLNDMVLTCYPYSREGGAAGWRSTELTFAGVFAEVPGRPDQPLSVVLAMGDDVTLYEVGGRDSLVHTATYDAMSFVQASKQNRRYAVFLPDFALLIESSRHVFVYQRLRDRQAASSPQYLYTLQGEERVVGWALLSSRLLIILTGSFCNIIALPDAEGEI